VTAYFETAHSTPQEAAVGRPCGSTCDGYVLRIKDGLLGHPEYVRSRHRHVRLQLLLY